jgi:hypothetical protein
MMIPGAVFIQADGLPQRNYGASQLEDGLDVLGRDPCRQGEESADLPLYPPCIPVGRGPAIALIGDSHAADLADAFRAIASKSGLGLIEFGGFVGASCLTTADLNEEDSSFVDPCVRFNTKRLNYIASHSEIEIAVVSGDWTDSLETDDEGESREVTDGQPPSRIGLGHSQASLEQGLEESVGQLSRAGKTVYLVQDQPHFRFNPALLTETRAIRPRYLLSHLLVPRGRWIAGDFAPVPVSSKEETCRRIVAGIAAKYPNVRVIDLRSELCSGDSCRFAFEGRTLYVDEDHLSDLGAQFALAGFHLP